MREKWLPTDHASHLDHPLSPYQAWQGSVLCPHLLEWGRNFSSSQSCLQTWKWCYSQAGAERESTKNPQRKVYTSCALHLALCESAGWGWQQLMSQFQWWRLNTQTTVLSDHTTWRSLNQITTILIVQQGTCSCECSSLACTKSACCVVVMAVTELNLMEIYSHVIASGLENCTLYAIFVMNYSVGWRGGSFAPVCSTWSFLTSSLLAWAALPLLGNRLQDELLGLTPEGQWWNTQRWIDTTVSCD